MINLELAAAFDRIADLMEINGDDGFRINSYRRVARLLKSHPRDIAVEAAEGSLTDLPGVGKATAEKIGQYIATGRIALLDELESKLPPTLPDLLQIQGLGPKKIAAMHKELNIAGLEDLKREIESGRLAKLAGFGAQSVKKITEGIAFLESSGGRTPMGVAWPIAEAVAEFVRGLDGVTRVDIAGSLRRGSETIGDIDLLCECTDGERIVKAFVEQKIAKRVLAAGGTKGSITVELDRGRETQVDLRVVPSGSYGAAFNYFTGSKEHNVRLREMAVKKKWRLNEYGLYDGEKQIAGRTEESIYKKLGLPFIPPELREDRGELDLAETPPLVSLDDIRGDLHMHTVASDGSCTIEEMADAAKAKGYQYIAITDHSKSSTIANGLTSERMRSHIDEIRAAGDRIKGITIFVGCECDILADGEMDYPDEILAQCDIVVASIHARHEKGDTSPTERLIRAIRNPYVTFIGHATTRLINQRPALDIDMAAVLAEAAKTHTAMEINAAWQRLDLKAEHVRQAVDAGVMLVINTDAHRITDMEQMRFGLATARRGWAGPDNILNTRTLKPLQRWLTTKRG